MNKISFYNFDLPTLESYLQEHNLKPYAAKQLFNWVYKKNVTDFRQMSNIGKANQELLASLLVFDQLTIIKVLADEKKETIKFLFKLKDDNCIETVIMKFDYGYSVCVSTQVGCNMGCKFCASGTHKKIRNLEASEIVLQFVMANNWLLTNINSRLSNIVVMGIGEPLDNLDNVITALKIITNQHGLEIGSRHITISTCGLCNKILTLAKALPQVNLAISLHASNDATRSKLMPINKTFNLDQLIQTCKKYLEVTNRRLTFEYILLDEINDSDENAYELVDLLKGLLCYVNLIPYNETYLSDFKRSKRVKQFFNILNKNKLQATIRLERGTNIAAACGQLRIQHHEKN
ncbi:MAG: 23S rRNA (adenine(2503)-C(2))-methyltransferase RlmN [Mycoplasmoidaceae bacterium]